MIRPFIGISFAQDRSLEELGVRGILVLRTQDGSPAAKAGIKGTSRDEYGRLKLGDVLIGLNGIEVKYARMFSLFAVQLLSPIKCILYQVSGWLSYCYAIWILSYQSVLMIGWYKGLFDEFLSSLLASKYFPIFFHRNATDLYRALDKCKVGQVVDVEVSCNKL